MSQGRSGEIGSLRSATTHSPRSTEIPPQEKLTPETRVEKPGFSKWR